MSDRDVDAEFADIIAHWDDVENFPGPAPRDDSPQREDGNAEAAPDGSPPDDTVPGSRGDRPGHVNPSPLADRVNPVNPPPLLGSVPVWRGATGGQPGSVEPGVAAEAGDTDDTHDDEDHFEPGPTAPLPPQEDVQFWGIIVGLVAGPLILLWLVLFRPNVSDWWLLIALGLTIGGFGLLVMRQPHSRDEDDPDNGARV
jgi:hypothetical protein